MSLSGYQLLLLCILLILISTSQWAATEMSLPSIITSPTSKNVSLNGKASFTCSALYVVVIFWRVNYTSIDSIPDLDDRYDYETIGNMSISKVEIKVHRDLEIETLNNSEITCIGYGLLEGNVSFTNSSSPPARLLIQGTLDAPSNVSSIYDNSMFVVSWLPPFTLEGVHVKYLVQITEVSENDNGTIVKEDVTENETASIIHADNSSDTLYMTCVTPMTDAGKGLPGCANVSSNDANAVMIALSTMLIALICVMTLLYTAILL